MDSLSRWEFEASVFYKWCGYLRPGKSIPAEIDGDRYRDEQKARWGKFVEMDTFKAMSRALDELES